MLKTIAIIVVVLIAGVLIFAATKPDTFRVQRAASIKAPPEKVFAFINDFNRWGAWSPWEKKDPAMKRTFGAVTSGKGDTTNVTWSMQGHTPYFAKIIHVFFNMDSMVGKDFEAGLANLKAAAEK